MRSAQLSANSIASFSRYYGILRTGRRGYIAEEDIRPVAPANIPALNELEQFKTAGQNEISRTIIIKLNGGLGTTMGCKGPKSLIRLKNGLHFLDVSIKQTLKLRHRYNLQLPLLLMNSFNTDPQTQEVLSSYPEINVGIPLSFVQNRYPRICRSTFKPAVWRDNPQLEWNPPGHGDIYSSLLTRGILDELLKKNFRYAFISNIDNLGATLSPAIPGFMAANAIEFLMEVADRTPMDRKGGHIAQTVDGQLLLRESAQCPTKDISAFQDITRHRFFNTNNLWIDLEALKKLLSGRNGIPELPMICNQKRIDPSIPDAPFVYQLESAMGSALSVFDKTSVLSVPRSRFIPIKNCEDLMLLQSDFFELTSDFTIKPFSENLDHFPVIQLDKKFYSKVDDFTSRFPEGVPSLRQCESLSIEGDFLFGKSVTIRGTVNIRNATGVQQTIPDNCVIDRDRIIN